MSDLSFMAGAWEGQWRGGAYEEHWTEAYDGSLSGLARMKSGGRVTETEFMVVEPEGDGFAMWVQLGSPSAPTPRVAKFRLASSDGRRAVFENPGNEFPSRLVYERLGPTRLRVVLEGRSGGEPRSSAFEMDLREPGILPA